MVLPSSPLFGLENIQVEVKDGEGPIHIRMLIPSPPNSCGILNSLPVEFYSTNTVDADLYNEIQDVNHIDLMISEIRSSQDRAKDMLAEIRQKLDKDKEVDSPWFCAPYVSPYLYSSITKEESDLIEAQDWLDKEFPTTNCSKYKMTMKEYFNDFYIAFLRFILIIIGSRRGAIR